MIEQNTIRGVARFPEHYRGANEKINFVIETESYSIPAVAMRNKCRSAAVLTEGDAYSFTVAKYKDMYVVTELEEDFTLPPVVAQVLASMLENGCTDDKIDDALRIIDSRIFHLHLLQRYMHNDVLLVEGSITGKIENVVREEDAIKLMLVTEAGVKHACIIDFKLDVDKDKFCDLNEGDVCKLNGVFSPEAFYVCTCA